MLCRHSQHVSQPSVPQGVRGWASILSSSPFLCFGCLQFRQLLFSLNGQRGRSNPRPYAATGRFKVLKFENPVTERNARIHKITEEEVHPAKPVQSFAVLCRVCFHLAASRAGEIRNGFSLTFKRRIITSKSLTARILLNWQHMHCNTNCDAHTRLITKFAGKIYIRH